MNNNGKQQIILLPMNNSRITTNGIIVSDPRGLDMETCLTIDNENYHAITVLVTMSENIISHPIDMISVPSISKGMVGKI